MRGSCLLPLTLARCLSSTPTAFLVASFYRQRVSARRDYHRPLEDEQYRGRLSGLQGSLLTGTAHEPRMTQPTSWRDRISLLGQAEAKAIDEELMTSPGFSIDTLMELAGFSVAQAVDSYLCEVRGSFDRRSSVLILCGPGNNGGDGLVAARHLFHFGYRPTVVYPKRPSKPLYQNLVAQVQDLGIEVVYELPEDIDGRFDVVVDSIFGFGTSGAPRAPFDSIIRRLGQLATPVVSVDIPSGWDVEQGDVHATAFNPEALVSLTAPKKCAYYFHGRHYLGGRFVPPRIRNNYGLDLPTYPGTSQFVEIEGWESEAAVEQDADGSSEFIVVWVTASNLEEAKRLSDGLIDDDLAACVNIIPKVDSVYKWEGKVERGSEVLMMAKTRRSLLPELTSYVKKHHSYTVPETIAGSIAGGSEPYLDWIRQNTRQPQPLKAEGETK